MPTPGSSNNPLDSLIAEYLEAVDRGTPPDRQQFIDAHLEFAAELAEFFANIERVASTRLRSELDPDATVIGPNAPKPGTVLAGRYKLLENIGEGGMGSVWVAEQQQPVKRRVAIKLVKAGMDSKQVLARFDAERQALALMDHPNIAKVFDGGMTEHGRPFFVMEYVKGVPFTEYCDKARLSLKGRLELFIPVCQAVQHAHHKGIVHRDLRPSNILICLYDGKPVPKVIDFGLAKAMHQPLTEQSLFTGHGVMVGTPFYMSPEQAEHNNLDVDTRTDIYSLGVVLYELLTGTTPLEREQLRTAAYNEVLRLIKEVEPPRPSTRLSGSTGLASIAAQRSIDPRNLQKSLTGDLDWIVMKSLEKERSRRYETANGLVRDIERFLNAEAVEACPPSRVYRLKKFIRKHRGQVIAVSAVLLTLVGGIVGTSWALQVANNARIRADQQSLQLLTQNRRLIMMWENSVNELLLTQDCDFVSIVPSDPKSFKSFSVEPLTAAEAVDAGTTSEHPMRFRFEWNDMVFKDMSNEIPHMERSLLNAMRCQRQHAVGRTTEWTTRWASIAISWGHVSWAGADRFGPGYLNGWAFGPKNDRCDSGPTANLFAQAGPQRSGGPGQGIPKTATGQRPNRSVCIVRRTTRMVGPLGLNRNFMGPCFLGRR